MFRRILGILAICIMAFALTACGQGTAGNGGTGNQAAADKVSEQQMQGNKKILVAYFTWSNRTEKMAQYIAEKTGGDLYKIEPANPYPAAYNDTTKVARRERDENQRPAIANLPASLDEYDVIMVGYPIWWHTAPMIIGTFLENYDLTGKEIYPFAQSAAMDEEHFRNSMDFIRSSSKNANVHEGVYANESARSEIDEYLQVNGLMK